MVRGGKGGRGAPRSRPREGPGHRIGGGAGGEGAGRRGQRPGEAGGRTGGEADRPPARAEGAHRPPHGGQGVWRRVDREGAGAFAAAWAAGIARIVYLGGPGHGDGLSCHLASRQGKSAGSSARLGSLVGRIPRLNRARLRQPLLRAGPCPGREASGDGDAKLGGHSHAADRDRRSGGYLVAVLDLPWATERDMRSADPTGHPRQPHAGIRSALRSRAPDAASAGAHPATLSSPQLARDAATPALGGS